MPMTWMAAVLTVLAVTTRTDTTFRVRPPARLNVNNFGGEIAVRTWEKNSVRIQAEHSDRVRVVIEDSGPDIQVRAAGVKAPKHHGHEFPGQVFYEIDAPASMALVLSGVNTDVWVDGTRAEVLAQTVNGRVRLRGGKGFIRLSSVQGPVDVGGARGRLEASSINDNVVVTDVEGDVSVEAVNGHVMLERVRARMVEAATVNGNVTYGGSFSDQGHYRFASHSGDLVIAIPQSANATVSVATFSGAFDSSFPIQLRETRRGRQFDFVVGSGSAKVDLETFAGTINLRRAVREMTEALERQSKAKRRLDEVKEALDETKKQLERREER